MNDERPIEKLLRRAADQRRGEAGAPPDLHPANRRLLQDEVKRQFPETQAARESGWANWWQNLQPRWVYAVGMAAVLLLLALLLQPALFKTNQTQLALNTPSANETPVTNLTLTAAPPAESVDLGVSTELAAAEATVPPSGGGNRREPELALKSAAPTVAAGRSGGVTRSLGVQSSSDLPRAKGTAETMSRADQLSVATLADDKGKLEFAGGQSSVEMERQTESTTLGALAPASSPVRVAKVAQPTAGTLLARAGEEKEVLPRNSQAFANLNAEQNRAGKKDDFGYVQPVLANFKIEQQGRDMQVIDADGSIYRGVVDEGNTLYKQVLLEKDRLAVASYGNAQKFQAPKAAEAVSPAQQQSSDYFLYRVEGTNRTLNQNVIFYWNFVPTNEAMAAAQVDYQKNLLQTDGNVTSQLPALLNNSYINGRAQFGSGSELQINAAPIKE